MPYAQHAATGQTPGRIPLFPESPKETAMAVAAAPAQCRRMSEIPNIEFARRSVAGGFWALLQLGARVAPAGS